MSRRVVVISGMSGAGKSSALKAFEDLGYYCVDNLPPALVGTVVELCERATPSIRHVALAIDVRAREFLEQLVPNWTELRERDPEARLLFFDAEDPILVQRFSETRRPHPLAPKGTMREGIETERKLLEPVRSLADDVIDTSGYGVRELREFVAERFEGEAGGLNLAVMSFGFSRGLPTNADLVLDVRFLPNPHYEEELRPQSGLDEDVRSFVQSRPETDEFLTRVKALLDFLIPRYTEEGKSYLTIAFGCTGGRHRSVAIAEIVGERLQSDGYEVSVVHNHLAEAARVGDSDGL